MTNTERTHLTVIKYEGHREVGYFTPEDIRNKIAYAEMYEDTYVRDIDCSASCWCVEEGSYDHYRDRLV